MNVNPIVTRLRRLLLTLATASLSLPALQAQAANLNISPVPLYLGGAIEPNVMFTLDDSGSMYWSYMPDDIYPDLDTDRSKAFEYNRIYYNPRVNYTPPVNSVGVPYPDANFASAWNDGYAAMNDPASTCTVDLGVEFRPSWDYGDNCDGVEDDTGWPEFAGPPEPAYYYIYYSDHPDPGKQVKPGGCSDSVNDDDCYLKVVVSDQSGADRNGDGVRSAAEKDERTNFANWYSYYRRRIYLAKAAIGQSFAQQGTGMRVGYGAINNGTVSIDGVNTRTIVRGVRHFDGSDREQFFDWLYGEQPSGWTPLRRATDDVGVYFKRDDDAGPWSSTPGQTGGKDYTCRQSYHIIMSDGYWNGQVDNGDDYSNEAQANVDNTDGPSHTHPTDSSKNYSYEAKSPFKDDFSATLADVAMYYWKNDLRADLGDNVPTSPADPAFWQHLVTFTVGLGVEGTIDPEEAFAAINDANINIEWSNPSGIESIPEKIDDLLHAAVNSRGSYFSAKDPQSFAKALSSFLVEIAERTSSASAVSLNGGSLFGGSRLYQARFNSQIWTGDILAYALDSSGNVSSSPLWKASEKIPGPGARRIVTISDGKGIPFRWSKLTAAQKSALGNAGILWYIRGRQTKETPNGPYRKRDSILGDIVHSAPLYVGPPGSGYPDIIEGSSNRYSQFVLDNYDRTPMVYAGGNDGMLHAFKAGNGRELFAYVPGMLLGKLKDLTEPGYSHRYYVDGTPVVLDAFFGNAWHTVLVGGLGGGGQGLYALDVTDPPKTLSSKDENAVSKMVLWEFTDADDSDLGYTYSRPNIVKLANGKWAAVFGNGYNNTESDGHASSTGNAVLYVVDIESGSLIKKIDTLTGSSKDPTGGNRPNGLATVAPVDVDGDYVVDYVYGGDLFGNLWKFDLSSSTANDWKVAFGTASKPKPLFRALAKTNDTKTAQPITVRPVVAHHPTGRGYLVYFGTGKFFEVGDNKGTGQVTQSFYAVWDQEDKANASHIPLDRDDLLQQKIVKEGQTDKGFEYRLTTKMSPTWDDPESNGVDSGKVMGWFLDLYNTEGGNTDNKGERQVSDPILRDGRIIFTTLIPFTDPCASTGAGGWLMELDAGTGGRLPFSPFDTDFSHTFTTADLVSFDENNDGNEQLVAASGKKMPVGSLGSPAIIADVKNKKEKKYGADLNGKLYSVDENPGPGNSGRKSWRELLR